MSNGSEKTEFGLGLTFSALIILIVGANALCVSVQLRLLAWLLTLLLLAAVCVAIGYRFKKHWAGLVIDNRNCLSLSKLQMTAWTVLILSALATAGAANLHDYFANAAPLEITIPSELIYAMGIAAVSLTAAPAILSIKAGSAPNPENVNKAVDGMVQAATFRADDAKKKQLHNGKVFTRPDGEPVTWTDIFCGDEIGIEKQPDLSKIQQVLITVLLLVLYGFAVGTMFAGTGHIDGLPSIGSQFIWLLAVSHASYLTYKAAPHTSDAPK